MANNKDKERIVSLQKQVSIAKQALGRIARGASPPSHYADVALENMFQIEIGKTHAADVELNRKMVRST